LFTDSHQHLALLINDKTFGIDELGLKVLKGVVVKLKLALERAV
jgi:hypothetical protein